MKSISLLILSLVLFASCKKEHTYPDIHLSGRRYIYEGWFSPGGRYEKGYVFVDFIDSAKFQWGTVHFESTPDTYPSDSNIALGPFTHSYVINNLDSVITTYPDGENFYNEAKYIKYKGETIILRGDPRYITEFKRVR